MQRWLGIPRPTAEDLAARSERTPMTQQDRLRWLQRHGLGLGLGVLAYFMITVLRGLRADFAPELWKGLGTAGQSWVFTRSELWVTPGVVAANAVAVAVKYNRRALSFALVTGMGGLGLVGVALAAQSSGLLSSFGFMVLLGLGLYLPYVAVHTTIFERLIALTRDRGNLGLTACIAACATPSGIPIPPPTDRCPIGPACAPKPGTSESRSASVPNSSLEERSRRSGIQTRHESRQ